MAVSLIPGASKKLTIDLKDSAGAIIDPASVIKVQFILYRQTDLTEIVRYSTLADEYNTSNYEEAEIDGNYIIIRIGSSTTDDLKPGTIMIQTNIFITNASFPDNVEVDKSKGELLRIAKGKGS